MKKKYWIAGILVSSLGLLLARVIPRFLDQPYIKLACYLAGVALALAGLVIIVFGIGKGRGDMGESGQ